MALEDCHHRHHFHLPRHWPIVELQRLISSDFVGPATGAGDRQRPRQRCQPLVPRDSRTTRSSESVSESKRTERLSRVERQSILLLFYLATFLGFKIASYDYY